MVPVADGPITLAATDDSIWVEAHRANIVTQIDPQRNTEVARLEDVPAHCTVISGGDFVWAANFFQGKITKIDPASGTILGTIGILDPCGLAADKTDLWVARPSMGQVERYDAATLEKRAVIPAAGAASIAIGPDAVWATSEDDGGTLWRIDPSTNQVVNSISFSNILDMGLVVGFGSVWVGSRTKGVIYRIDPATNAITDTIKVNNAIGGVGVGPDAIWASGFGDGTIYRIDPETNSASASLSTSFGNLGPPLVAFDSIWVAALDQNVVLRVDPAAFDTSQAPAP
jgi:DNA-binding beta-propeller fold protein YncE